MKAGTYRLTVSASGWCNYRVRLTTNIDTTCYHTGIFGDYVQDDIVVEAGKQTHVQATWVPESAGTELWRIGVPDKSAGEF